MTSSPHSTDPAHTSSTLPPKPRGPLLLRVPCSVVPTPLPSFTPLLALWRAYHSGWPSHSLTAFRLRHRTSHRHRAIPLVAPQTKRHATTPGYANVSPDVTPHAASHDFLRLRAFTAVGPTPLRRLTGCSHYRCGHLSRRDDAGACVSRDILDETFQKEPFHHNSPVPEVKAPQSPFQTHLTGECWLAIVAMRPLPMVAAAAITTGTGSDRMQWLGTTRRPMTGETRRKRPATTREVTTNGSIRNHQPTTELRTRPPVREGRGEKHEGNLEV